MVVELEPQLKRGLYAELARHGLTFKDWLISQAEQFIAQGQPPQPVSRKRGRQLRAEEKS